MHGGGQNNFMQVILHSLILYLILVQLAVNTVEIAGQTRSDKT